MRSFLTPTSHYTCTDPWPIPIGIGLMRFSSPCFTKWSDAAAQHWTQNLAWETLTPCGRTNRFEQQTKWELSSNVRTRKAYFHHELCRLSLTHNSNLEDLIVEVRASYEMNRGSLPYARYEWRARDVKTGRTYSTQHTAMEDIQLPTCGRKGGQKRGLARRDRVRPMKCQDEWVVLLPTGPESKERSLSGAPTISAQDNKLPSEKETITSTTGLGGRAQHSQCSPKQDKVAGPIDVDCPREPLPEAGSQGRGGAYPNETTLGQSSDALQQTRDQPVPPLPKIQKSWPANTVANRLEDPDDCFAQGASQNVYSARSREASEETKVDAKSADPQVLLRSDACRSRRVSFEWPHSVDGNVGVSVDDTLSRLAGYDDRRKPSLLAETWANAAVRLHESKNGRPDGPPAFEFDPASQDTMGSNYCGLVPAVLRRAPTVLNVRQEAATMTGNMQSSLLGGSPDEGSGAHVRDTATDRHS